MSEPESSDPKNPQSASDATQRFAAGEPPSPFATQRISLPKFLAEGTLKLPLPEPSAPAEPTQPVTIPVPQAESTLRMPLPELSAPAEPTQPVAMPVPQAESTLRMPLPELSVPEEPTQPVAMPVPQAESTTGPLPAPRTAEEPTQPVAVPLPPVESTLRMPLPELSVPAEQTQRFALPQLEEPPLRLPVLTEPVPVLPRPQASPGFSWKLPVALLLLALAAGGAGAYAYLHRAPVRRASPVPPAAPASASEAVPEAARVYLDQAKAGDANAMRMLGAMYYNGLLVPQDREKGLSWYRQAAEKGSATAKAELAQLEAAGK